MAARWICAVTVLSHLLCQFFDQHDLFAVVQIELAVAWVDQFQLPGHQRQAALQGVEDRIVEVQGMGGALEHAMNMQGEFGQRADCVAGRGLGQAQQAGEQAVDGFFIVSDQVQVAQACLLYTSPSPRD